MKKLYYVFAAIGLLGVIAWVVTYPRQRAAVQMTRTGSRLVTTVAPSAFGDFSASTVRPAAPQSTVTARDSANSTASLDETTKAMPTTQNIQFSYDGPVPTIPNVSVLKRIPSVGSDGLTNDIIRQATSALALDSFSTLRLDSYSVSETDPSGYTITQDYRRGVTSIYRQYSGSAEKLLYPSTPTPDRPALTDTESVAIAQAFLAAHQVALTNYGTPVVQSNHTVTADTSAISTRPSFWSPASSVIFPWLIQGTPVVDQSGFPYGLQVTVDAATRTVSGASNIANLQFNASAYPLVADGQHVVDVAKRGGVYTSANSSEAATVTVPLQTPTVVYMISTYQLAADDADYLVPALMFLVGKIPDGVTLYQSAVVVPLVESLLTPPTIEPAATNAGSGAVSTTPAVAPDQAVIVPIR